MTELQLFEQRFHGDEPLRPGDVRTSEERDRGRIVHCAAFRRLQGKTQVMGVGEGDFHRTRLTHSIECAQIGTGLLDQLTRSDLIPAGLCDWFPSEALIESACFAHDVGHPPFGHGGEIALHMDMLGCGGFEGNAHTLRLLTRLEKYKQQGWGINPTRRLILAVLKYPVPFSQYDIAKFPQKPPKCYFDEEQDIVQWALLPFRETERVALTTLSRKGKAVHRTFDSSLMELADDIAYGIHDIEDIVARGLADRQSIHRVLVEAFEPVGGRLSVNSGTLDADTICAGLFHSSFERKQTVSRLVSGFVTAVQVAGVREFAHPLLGFRVDLPQEHRSVLNMLRDLSLQLVIRKAQVRQLERRGQRIVSELFRALSEDPEQLIPDGSWDDGDATASRNRRVCDYVAGMTDGYAERVYRRLFVPGFGSSSDEL